MPTSGRQSVRARSWCETIVMTRPVGWAPSAPFAVSGPLSSCRRANAEAMIEHLAEISTQDRSAPTPCCSRDGAGWLQTGDKLRVPENISLLPIPPYSPELNPMENVWAYLRSNKLCALIWNSYDAIVSACKEAWSFLISDPKRIQSIGHREWTCVNL